MNLDTVAIHIRPRSPWEAIDIGFALARRWFFRLWGLWMCAALPALLPILVCGLLLPGSTAKWSLFLFWFFKPLYEPALVIWAGSALFGDEQTFSATIGKTRKRLTAKRIQTLFLGRFSFSRSFFLPIPLLETLEGAEKNARLALLRDGSGTAVLLSVSGLCIEAALAFSLLIALFWVIPENLRWMHFGSFVFTPDNWLLLLCYLAGCSLFAPFYVCAGFMMYISRRVELEAWDIEIGFKRLRQRLAQQQGRRLRTIAAIFLAFCLALTMGAEKGGAAAPAPHAAAITIAKVLKQRDFGKEVTQYRWVPKAKKVSISSSPWQKVLEQIFLDLAGLLKKVAPYLARFGAFLLWSLAGALIAFFLFKSSRLRAWLEVRFATAPGDNRQPPKMMFGMDLRPESLPEQIGATSLRLLEKGKKREALSLLYRGTLSHLIHRSHLEVHGSSTESECCRAVRETRPEEEAAYFSELTALWIALAYGHRDPDMERCRGIAGQWESYYGAGI